MGRLIFTNDDAKLVSIEVIFHEIANLGYCLHAIVEFRYKNW